MLAHKHSSRHRGELESSVLCGCFYCLSIFPSSEIVEWVDDDQTAICPKCPVDSVIGSASGFPITREFLRRMHDYWFS
ncbi:MAG TPA: cytoplasmic protein [Verrucomicrobiae bacterium]|nr:cytoplasmic protein [Verrucomicrobiae bacterium]